MRKLVYILTVAILLPIKVNAQFVQQQRKLDGNNIATYIINSGIADNNITINNTPGFEWPKGSGKFAIFTSGLTIAAKVNGQLRMAAASYNGEYRPGYILNGVPQTDSRFRIYSIKRGDTTFTNMDYAEWGNMVPYGAPYVDVNNNGTFELGIDRPGVKDASQTIFICLTDGFPESHIFSGEFGGGTAPLMAEVHFTAWCYDAPGLEDVQFRKWKIVNKSGAAWDGAIFSIVSDPDLGNASDDWIGCDTLLNMGYTYNGSNMDSSSGQNWYGINPPAIAISFLKTPKRSNGVEYGLTSLSAFTANQWPFCWYNPDDPNEAYNFMKGLQKDGTPHVNVTTMNTTRFLFDGDPETGAGWTEQDGRIENCNGDTTGKLYQPSPSGDRRMVMNSTDTNYNLSSGQLATFVASYQIARGSNYLNSVTKLKQLGNTIQNFWQTIGINPISSEIPNKFTLEQNYPNPFNPTTKIRFEIPLSVRGEKSKVRLSIFDIAGKEVAKLVNEELTPGVYEYSFDGKALASGMYFYRLEAGDFIETKKMVLLK